MADPSACRTVASMVDQMVVMMDAKMAVLMVAISGALVALEMVDS